MKIFFPLVLAILFGILEEVSVDYVDMITEPGPNKILSEGKDINSIKFLKKKIEVSVEKHNSKIIAVVARYDCAGNPESEDLQKEHLRNSSNARSHRAG